MLETVIPTIERTTINGKRHYKANFNGNNHTGISVTTLTDLFDPKPWKRPWYLKLGREVMPQWVAESLPPDELEAELLRLGEIEGNEVGQRAATIGTTWHKQIEDYYETQNPEFEKYFDEKPELWRFLQISTPYRHEDFTNGVGSEIPVVYAKNEKQTVGGTCDVLLNVSAKHLKIQKSNETLPDELFVVGDWKFNKTKKYPSSCLTYFLQLAAYREALLFTYNIKVEDALLIMSPNDTKKLNLYYLDKTTLDFYFSIFDEMLWLYANDMVEHFNWTDFAEKSKQFYGKNLVLNNVPTTGSSGSV